MVLQRARETSVAALKELQGIGPHQAGTGLRSAVVLRCDTVLPVVGLARIADTQRRGAVEGNAHRKTLVLLQLDAILGPAKGQGRLLGRGDG